MNSQTKSLVLKLKEKVKLFKGLTPDEIVLILNKGQKVSFNESDLVLKEGDMGNHFFITLGGELHAYTYENGEQVVVNRLKAGNLVGEVGALFGIRRTAYVKCKSDCMLLKYTHRLFDQIEAVQPYLAIKLYKNVVSIIIDKYIEK